MPVLDAQWIERKLGVARTTKQQERLADGEFLCCRPVYVGRNILICGRKDSIFPFQCLVGPDWPCMMITYTIITVPTIIFFILVASQIGWLALLLGLVTFSLTIICFSLTACSDPGIVYRKIVDEEAGVGGPPSAPAPAPAPTAVTGASGNSSSGTTTTDPAAPPTAATPLAAGDSTASQSSTAPLAGPVTTPNSSSFVARPEQPVVVASRSGAPVDPNARIPCSRCEMSRPMGASHCYDCEVCVKGLDHHCPWTGKCIGKKNLCYFYAFLISLTIHILYVGVTTGMNAITVGFKMHDSQ